MRNAEITPNPSFPGGGEPAGQLMDRLAAQLAAQQAANLAEGTPNRVLRRDRLGRIGAMVRANRDAIITAIDEDFGGEFGGRAREETLLGEVFTTLSCIRHARNNLGRWMRPRARSLDLAFKPARAKLMPQPLGVVGVISPWNYPVFLALAPLVGAIAAGNRVMLKPSEVTPRTAALLAELLAGHFSPEEIAVVQGGQDVGEAFSRLPFDHLLYTGSTHVGRKIMAAAAENLTPVTLELGGKSPAVIAPDANLAAAATSIVRGKLFNAGQTCVAPDYVLAPRHQVDGIAELLVAKARQFYPVIEANPDYTAIVNQAQFDRLQAMRGEAESLGARLRTADKIDIGGRKMPLTILLDTTAEMAVRGKEIFGPLLPIIPYDDIGAAITHVNGGPRPLALYVYGADRGLINRVLEKTMSGGAVVNDCLIHAGVEELPFGGVGASGMGHYHGREGFETFSKLKPVMYQSRWNGLWLLNPPYGARARGMINLLLNR